MTENIVFLQGDIYLSFLGLFMTDFVGTSVFFSKYYSQFVPRIRSSTLSMTNLKFVSGKFSLLFAISWQRLDSIFLRPDWWILIPADYCNASWSWAIVTLMQKTDSLLLLSWIEISKLNFQHYNFWGVRITPVLTEHRQSSDGVEEENCFRRECAWIIGVRLNNKVSSSMMIVFYQM